MSQEQELSKDNHSIKEINLEQLLIESSGSFPWHKTITFP